jgi:hypothetical protein
MIKHGANIEPKWSLNYVCVGSAVRPTTLGSARHVAAKTRVGAPSASGSLAHEIVARQRSCASSCLSACQPSRTAPPLAPPTRASQAVPPPPRPPSSRVLGISKPSRAMLPRSCFQGHAAHGFFLGPRCPEIVSRAMLPIDSS